MNTYTAMVIHNIAIISLTAVAFIFSDYNVWTLLILICLTKTGKSDDSKELE